MGKGGSSGNDSSWKIYKDMKPILEERRKMVLAGANNPNNYFARMYSPQPQEAQPAAGPDLGSIVGTAPDQGILQYLDGSGNPVWEKNYRALSRYRNDNGNRPRTLTSSTPQDGYNIRGGDAVQNWYDNGGSDWLNAGGWGQAGYTGTAPAINPYEEGEE